MNQRFFTLLIIILLASFSTQAQQSQMFEPKSISNDGVFGLTISPDGKTALWVESKGSRAKLEIMESRFENGKWNKATIAPFSGKSEWKDIDPMFSPDGNTVLFQSNRPVPGQPNRQGFDIWSVKNYGKGWFEPVHLGNVINSDDSESYASMSKKGNIYFMKENPDGTGKSDIYVSEYTNGSYQTPKNLGLPVNTGQRESNPYISPDEDFLIYFSDDSQGFGDVDLYVSFKKSKKWTIPQNLGGNINSEIAEFCPFFHKKQNRLYFSRQKKVNERFQENLFYYESFDKVLKSLRKTAEVSK